MLGLWGIDDVVVASVAYHNDPSACPCANFSPVTAVYAASLAADAMELEQPLPLSAIINNEYVEKLGLADRVDEWQALCVPPDEDAA